MSRSAPRSSLYLITRCHRTPPREEATILGMSFIPLHSEQALSNWRMQGPGWSHELSGTRSRKGIWGPIPTLALCSPSLLTWPMIPLTITFSHFTCSPSGLLPFHNYFSADCLNHHKGHSMRQDICFSCWLITSQNQEWCVAHSSAQLIRAEWVTEWIP